MEPAHLSARLELRHPNFTRRGRTMNGLKLVAAGLCGSALTLGLTALAQAPKRAPVVECPAPAALQSIESDVSQMASRLDLVAPPKINSPPTRKEPSIRSAASAAICTRSKAAS